MTQTLYAHMNKRKTKKIQYWFSPAQAHWWLKFQNFTS
jgi:hypothetical protein